MHIQIFHLWEWIDDVCCARCCPGTATLSMHACFNSTVSMMRVSFESVKPQQSLSRKPELEVCSHLKAETFSSTHVWNIYGFQIMPDSPLTSSFEASFCSSLTLAQLKAHPDRQVMLGGHINIPQRLQDMACWLLPTYFMGYYRPQQVCSFSLEVQ